MRTSPRGHIFGVALLLGMPLLLAMSASAAVFEAGPGSTPFRTLQQAIDDAIAAGGFNTIRVRDVTIAHPFTPITIPETFTAGSLIIEGGYDESFARVGTTKLEGVGAGSVLVLRPRGGSVELRWFEVTNGDGDSAGQNLGGGIHVDIDDGAEVSIRDSMVHGNHARNGGGIHARVIDGMLTIVGSSLFDNVVSGTTTAQGGGLYALLGVHGNLHAHFNRIEGNEGDALEVTGAGAFVRTSEDWEGVAWLSGNDFLSNSVPPTGTHDGAGSAFWIDGGSLTVDPSRWIGNGAAASSVAQLQLVASKGNLRVLNSLVAQGPNGIEYSQLDGALSLSNLTVSDHDGFALSGDFDHEDPFAAEFHNGIVWNGTIDDIPVWTSLIGIDPLFVAPETDDYGLQAGSPAIGCGSLYGGGSSDFDLAGNPRPTNGRWDCGALQYVPEPEAWSAVAAVGVLLLLRARGRGAASSTRARESRALPVG